MTIKQPYILQLLSCANFNFDLLYQIDAHRFPNAIMKFNHRFVLLITTLLLSFYATSSYASKITAKTLGAFSPVSRILPEDTTSNLPLYGVLSLTNGQIITVYERNIQGHVNLVASLFSNDKYTQISSITIDSNILLQDVVLLAKEGNPVVVARTSPNDFRVYYLAVNLGKVWVKQVVNVKSLQWGENLSFYPNFGVSIVNNKIWICLADAVDNSISNNTIYPLPPTLAQSQVRLHWSFLAGDKLWKVGSYTIKFKPRIGTPVNMCWLPSQGFVTTFGRQILLYNSSKRQISEIKSLFAPEGTYWSGVAAHGQNQILAVSANSKKQSFLLLMDVKKKSRVKSLKLPAEVPTKHSTTTLNSANGKYLLSYYPYVSRLVPDAGPHGASVPYYTYKGIKLMKIYVK